MRKEYRPFYKILTILLWRLDTFIGAGAQDDCPPSLEFPIEHIFNRAHKRA